MQIDKIKFVYSSICRDIKQSDLAFWSKIAQGADNEKYRDVFIKVGEMAKKDKNKPVCDFIKGILKK